jgi:16S rRNA (guanine(966)-N(2))-methyltransferase RsmD
MRIIAGKYKSRRISMPKNFNALRPTSDRARETLFDVLANKADFENGACLDLFAGTGALGFEALSRGAGRAVFVDLSGKNIEVIKLTADLLGCGEQISAFRADALKYLKENSGDKYDFVFADPPYDYRKYNELSETVLKLNPVLFVLETSNSFKETYDSAGYNLYEKKVGAAKFSIFISK